MTFEPDGELDLIVAESLRDRAAHATVHGRGMGDVRRRVRRRRQRQMAVGLVPAMAGLGWAVTRPATHAPLNPSGEAGPCGETATTWLGSSPTTTFPPSTTTSGSDVTVSTISYDANGNVVDPYGNPLGTTTTGIVGPLTTDSDGNAMDAYGNVITVPFVTDGNGNPVLVNTTWADEASFTTATVYEATSTTVCEPTTVPATTDVSQSSTAIGDSTTTTSVVTGVYSSVLFANASQVNGAAAAYSRRYPGSSPTNATVKADTSYVMYASGSEELANRIAGELGIVDWQNGGSPIVQAGIDASVVEGAADGYTVVVVIGYNHAISLSAPTTTTPHS